MRRAWLYVVLFSLLVNLPLLAQKVTGTITGTVTDSGGAVISGAEVTVSVVVDVAKITWFPKGTFLSGQSLKGQFTMRRE